MYINKFVSMVFLLYTIIPSFEILSFVLVSRSTNLNCEQILPQGTFGSIFYCNDCGADATGL